MSCPDEGDGGRPAKRSHAEVAGFHEDDEDERRCAEAVREYMTRIEPRWLKRSNVERRCVDTLSREEFVEKYEKPRIPVILTGVVSKWLAATEWTRKRLLERFGEKTFRVSASVDMTLREYLVSADRSEAQHELRPLYLFDKDFCSKCPEMVAEFSVPPYFEEDLMDVLGAANFVRTQTLRTYEPLLVTALVYLVLALLIENVFRRLAHRLPTRSGF